MKHNATDPDYGPRTTHPNDPRNDDFDDEPSAEEMRRMQDDAEYDNEMLREDR